MPLYDYKCPNITCGDIRGKHQFERFLSVADCDKPQKCPRCGLKATKIIVLGHGGIQREDPSWIKGVGQSLETPMETIGDLRKYYNEHPNIRPVESHPALPSSLACETPTDPGVIAKERTKAGIKKVADMRRVSIHT